MKLPHIFRRKSSISKRLTWRVVLSMTLIFTVILAFILLMIWAVGIVILLGLNITAMEVSNEKINNVFATVETAVSNNIPEVKENIGNDQRQYYAQKNLLTLNPNIVGAAVAYNPNYNPKKGQPFSPYAFRDSTGIHTKQLNDNTYDYLHKDWYLRPIEEGKGVWSEPYFDYGGSELSMITYSLPLFNSNGEIYAVQTADISLGWLENIVRDEQGFNNNWVGDVIRDEEKETYKFIVNHKGHFVVHPDKSQALNGTLHDYLSHITPNSKDLEKEILSGGKGNMQLYRDMNNKHYVIFYASIINTGWVMGVIVPLRTIMMPVICFLGVIILLMVGGLIIVAMICHSVIRHVTKPLRRFADSADEIAKGNFQTELPKIKTQDEMLRLRDSFETMQSSLIRQIEETKTINEEKGRIKSELSIASKIQMAMLPKTYPPYPDRSDLDIFGQLTPAKEVGGDLYDFCIRDDKLFFCIGDVSGKGVPASLVMAMTRAMFRIVLVHENRPSRILTTINNAMTEANDSNMFVTIFVGVLDLPTGRLRYCNGGHNAPITIYQDRVRFLKIIPNLPLGIVKNFNYKEQETVMPSEASIFLYTDGLNEAENNEQQQLGNDRVIEVAKQMLTLSPQKQINLMTKIVTEHAHGAEQSDDLTMLSIKFVHPQDENAKTCRLTLTNKVEELTQLPDFIDKVCEEAGVDMALIASLNLAVEEAVTNVVLYAYPNCEGSVDIDAVYTDKYLKFIITDHGVPFDPTKKEDADTTLSAEERPIGGLGIFLVRQIMDSVNYERFEGQNVLTLTKKLEPIDK